MVRLRGGMFAVVDADVIPLIREIAWRANRCNQKRTWYASASDNGKTVLMHRLIMGESNPNVLIDHVDGNGLNNRRSNLCRSNQSANNRNFHTVLGKSKYRGVFWVERDQRWRSTIRVNGRIKYLGQFVLEVEAAKAFDEAARLFFPGSRTNFPLPVPCGAVGAFGSASPQPGRDAK